MYQEKKSLLMSQADFFFFCSGYNSSQKHRDIPFVQFYEMHTNDIIVVTGSKVHMQIKIQRYVQMWIVHS